MPTQFPNKDEIVFKDGFEKRYKALLGEEYDEYKRYTLSFLRRCIRVNTLKITVAEMKKRLDVLGWDLTPIPWTDIGFWVEHREGRRDIGNTREFSLGYYYVQEAASMIPPLALTPEKSEVILDIAASPGSKTTQIAQMMENTGLLIANDVSADKMNPLGFNVQRLGITNTIITYMQGQWFRKAGIVFDRILVDAPCSGTGSIRKSLGTLRIWNPESIKKLSVVQKQLIDTAYTILKPGGVMVYSTCSNEPHEDEAVVSHLLEKYPEAAIEDIDIVIKRSSAVTEFEGEKYHPDVKKTLRVWPHVNDTEGFYVARIRKGK